MPRPWFQFWQRRPLPRGCGQARHAAAEMSVAFPAMRKFARLTETPCDESFSISEMSAQGSITTPFPMIESLPGRTMPEGTAKACR